jgi:hypothetical protein
VQAWEDCANSENREDPLIRQAKQESSGSAVAAINLVRSTSSTSSSALKPRSSNVKRRAPAQAGVAKRYKTDKPPNSRVRTDTALAPINKHNQKTRVAEIYLDGKKPNSIGTATAFWNNDSDKENWSPDEDGNPRRSATTTATGRRPLPSAPPATSRLDATRNPRRTSAHASRTTSLQRGNTSPGSWASYSKRYRPKPTLHQSLSQSALEIYEDAAEEEEEDDQDQDGSDGGEDDDDCGRRRREDAACKDLLSMCGVGVSPSKEKDVAAATGLLSLKWGR